MHAGHRPDAELYVFLASICELNENNPELEVQRWTRELLLGHSAATARESCFFHQLRLVPAKKNAASSTPGSVGSGQSPGTPLHKGLGLGGNNARAKTTDGAQGNKAAFVVEVEMARWGKRRPTFAPDNRAGASDNTSAADPKVTATGASFSHEKTYPRLSPVPGLAFEEWRDGASDETLVAAKKTWRPLAALDVVECRIITASLRLLATLCAGKGRPHVYSTATTTRKAPSIPCFTLLCCLSPCALSLLHPRLPLSTK